MKGNDKHVSSFDSSEISSLDSEKISNQKEKIRSNVNWNQRYMWGSILFNKYNINR